MLKTKQKFKQWKQINFRSVNSAIGAEFLHELYNRYFPPVNSIRFRNTIITRKGTEVTSYAPIEEWNNLSEWYGEKFLRGKEDVYEALEDLMSFKKPMVQKLIENFKKTDFSEIDNIDLALALIDLQSATVGEIYRVNLVQVEHSLNYAIDFALKKYFPEESERRIAASYLVMSAEQTEANKEEDIFTELVMQGLSAGVTKLAEDGSHWEIIALIKSHKEKYAYMHSAYGASPYSTAYYIEKYNQLAVLGIEGLNKKIQDGKDKLVVIRDIKEEYIEKVKDNDILLKNTDYMTRIGELRDRNKALMGSTNVWRDKILDEVIKRTGVPQEELNLYLIYEICDLLKNKKRLSQDELEKRKKGYVLYRSEYVDYEYDAAKDTISQKIESKILKGVCASSGKAEGVVKLIRSSEDVDKMEQGDIMVSPGTDFDLINAMQKAGAIVTEEGGLLSHASVVSRELGVACVIGVQNATILLKEGMRVEVNADEGTIKIK